MMFEDFVVKYFEKWNVSKSQTNYIVRISSFDRNMTNAEGWRYKFSLCKKEKEELKFLLTGKVKKLNAIFFYLKQIQ